MCLTVEWLASSLAKATRQDTRSTYVCVSFHSRRQLLKWQRSRQFAALVAEDTASGQLLGCVSMSMMQPEALLPPPFPSHAQLRAYIGNMAVLPTARRRGVARALLNACEQLGKTTQEFGRVSFRLLSFAAHILALLHTLL